MRIYHIVGIIVVLFLAWWLSPLYYITLYPAVSEKTGGTINFYEEPIQVPTEIEPFFITDRAGRQVKIIPVATYEIQARIGVNRNYPNYFNVVELEDVLTSDMALVWGKFAEPNIMNKVNFSHQWTYSGFQYRDPKLNQEPGLQYLSEHFSSNHLVPASQNIDHALRRVRKYDSVRLTGYLIDLEIPGLPLVKTSLVRTDNWVPGQGNRGGSEFIYVTEFQNGEKVYH